MADDHRRILEDLYHAAVAGVNPGRAVASALASDPFADGPAPWILSLGKAGMGMCRAAIDQIESSGRAIPGALVVATDDGETPSPGVEVVRGDHPAPGRGSFTAAERIGAFVDRVSAHDEVLVLLSGGTSSLIAAPVPGISTTDITRLFESLLGSGADITTSNAIRKRFSRWAAGRLAVALAERGAARLRCLIVSDVIGDDPAVIASGPCVADALTADDVLRLIERDRLQSFLAPSVMTTLQSVARGELPETPKPDNPAFQRVTWQVILGNRTARDCAAARARETDLSPVKVVGPAIQGDAAVTGERLVKELVRFRDADFGEHDRADAAGCVIWGGETTVHLDEKAPRGGRCQELALAAARALDALGDRAHGISLVAAGTDGRDGPTDAAGAIVGASTWRAIASASRDPARDLERHESHASLESAGALLPSKLTGTNVGDVVIGLVTAR